MIPIKQILVILLTLAQAPFGFAADYYVAPPDNPETSAGPLAGDGSRAHPFSALEAALQSGRIKPGDTVYLTGGEYGKGLIRNVEFSAPVTIRPMEGKQAHFDFLVIYKSRNLHFSDLRVWPRSFPVGRPILVETGYETSDFVFSGLDLRGGVDAGTYPGWGREEWENRKVNGIMLRGPRGKVLDSQFTGLDFAISTLADDAVVMGNIITGFSGDGIRSLGDRSVVRNNLIRDCVAIDQNHDDGFQSWSGGPKPGTGNLDRLTIEANIILEWTGPKDHPLRCELQGIGLFDGTFSNLLIRNNLVVVSAYHGISVYGANRTTISNNTVIHPVLPSGNRPWIMVNNHGNGTPSRDVTVANNLAMHYILKPVKGLFVNRRNQVISYPARLFANPAAGDYRPIAGGPLSGAADPRYAPPTDLLGIARPLGTGPTLGAFEVDTRATSGE